MKQVPNELDDLMSLTVQVCCLGTGSMDECFLYHLDPIDPSSFLLPAESGLRRRTTTERGRRVMSNDREVSFRLLAHRAHSGGEESHLVEIETRGRGPGLQGSAKR